MANCCLSTELKTLGKPNCYNSFGIIKQIIFAPKGLAGVNLSSITNPINPSLIEYFPDFVNALSDSEIVITDAIDSIEVTKGDATFKEYDSGSKYFIKDGRYSFNIEFAVPTFGQLQAFKQLACRKLGVYLVNEKNQILGVEQKLANNNLILMPIPITDKSMSSIFNFATYSEVDRLNVQFTIDLFTESDLRIFDNSDALISNAFVFVPMNYLFNGSTEHILIDDTNDVLQFPLAVVNNDYTQSYLDLSDFDLSTSVVISLKNMNTNAITSITYLPTQITYNNTTKLFTCSGVTLPLSVGTKYKLHKISSLNSVYSKIIYSDKKANETNVAVCV